MKKCRVLFAAAAAVCAAQVFSATHTEVTTVPRLPFMRGMGIECGFDGTRLGNQMTYLDPQSMYDGLVAKGFDFMRLPIAFRDYTSYDSSTGVATLLETTTVSSGWFGGTTEGPGFRKFDEIVDMAEKAGLYIILDFHNWFDINPADAAQTNQFIAIWKALAEHYKDRSNKVIFELANEPRTHDYGKICTLQKNAIKEIRKTNPTRLILFDPGDASQPWVLTQCATPPKTGWVSLPNDNNVAVVVHSYNPGWFTHQGENWVDNPNMTKTGIDEQYYTGTNSQGVAQYTTARKTLKADLKYCQQYIDATGVKIVMNEFNVSSKQADKADITEYLSMITRWCESNNVPWAPWSYYARGSGFDCTDSSGNLYDYREAGLFPDLKTTNRFSTNDYPHAVDITFSGYSGSSALANFPVLVKLSESGINGFHYSDFTKTNGFDLCFTDASGNLLAHEIDTWNPNGVSTVWVKVPSLTSSTKIVARYGCAKPIVPKVESVWDSDYVGVWHLGEQKLPLADSSNVSRDVTSADGTGIGYGATGIVGGSVDFGAAGSSRCVNMDDHMMLDGFTNITVEAWTKQDAHATNAGIVSKRVGKGNQISYYMFDNGSGTVMKYSDSGSSAVESGVTMQPVLGQWNHQAYSFDATKTSSNSKGYLNGALKGTGSVSLSGNKVYAGTGELHVGNLHSGNATNFPGMVDEVRISKCVRSADWIKASYETVAKSNFATYAVEGVEPPPEPETVEYGPLATSDFAKFMSIRFDVIQAGTVLTNFPVLVKLSTAIDGFSYADFKKANGGDLRFADPDGNLVPHEIDTWNESGVSTVWVKIPRLTRNTIISAYYGCAGSVPAVAAKDVWDDDYVGVWHLGESALPMKESSETSSNFTNSYGTGIGYAAPGIVGGSVNFPTNGTPQALVAPDHDALDGFAKFTIEAWTFQNAHKTNGGILAKRKEYNNECAYYIYDEGTQIPFCVGTNRSTGAKWAFNQAQPMGQWNHVAFSADMSSSTKNSHGYMNGTMSTWEPNVAFFGAMPNCASDLYLGNLGANKTSYVFNGKIDEVRISKTVRSKEWVKATYDTIANSAFATYAVGTVLEPDNISLADLKLKARTDKDNPIDYVEGEQIRFDFFLDGVEALPAEARAKSPLYVIWTRRGDDGVTVMGTNTISLAQGFSVTTSLAIPGIIKMTGTLVGSDYKAFQYYDSSNNKKNVTFGGGAGVATEKMTFYAPEPADFDQFWAEAKAKLAAVPFNDSNVELVDITPSGAASKFTIYAVKVPCFGPRPVTGWMTIPKTVPAGGLAIEASFDGYGCVSAVPKAPTWGYSTNVHFHINAHGYDLVNRDNQYYKDFNDYINKTNRTFNGTTYGYALAPEDYDNPTNTYFYYMAMRVMRAYDYLKSRPEWNHRDVVASGGSQGGLQTMWAGGLVDGITLIKPSITWGCDIGCPFNGKSNTVTLISRTWGIPCVPGAFYFDSALHAKRVPRDCVAEITKLGLSDYTSPPRGVLLSYYNMKCQASVKIIQGADHGYSPPQPNQVFVLSKAAAEEIAPVFASDAAGFDYTNRVVTVTNATEGAALTLTATASDGTTTTATATVDANGEATFNVATAPGAVYSYTVAADGVDIAAGGFLTGGWDEGGTWFSASAESGASVVSGGAWAAIPGISNNRYSVDGGADFALLPAAAAAGSNGLVCVDIAAQFDSIDDASSLSGESLSGRIVGMTAATSGGMAKWMVCLSSGWKALAGGSIPQLNTPYVVRMEADFKSAPPKVRCSVSADGGDSFAVLSDEATGATWHDAAAAPNGALAGVMIDGDGDVASLRGALANANVVEADGVGYASLADAIAASTNTLKLLTNATWPTNTPIGTIAVNRGGYALQGVALDGNGKTVVQSGYSAIPGEGRVNISLAQAAALGVTTANQTPAQIAAALAANGANGIPRWKSYVLGLDPTKADSTPKATIAMNGDQVELALVGIDVNAASGATVSYKVYKFSDLANIVEQPVGGDRNVGATAEVPKDATAPRMFYRLKVDVKGY